MSSPPRFSISVRQVARLVTQLARRESSRALGYWGSHPEYSVRTVLFVVLVFLLARWVPVGGVISALWAGVALAILLGLARVPLLVLGAVLFVVGAGLVAARGNRPLAEQLVQQAYYALWFVVARQALCGMLISTRVGRTVQSILSAVEIRLGRFLHHAFHRGRQFFVQILLSLDFLGGRMLARGAGTTSSFRDAAARLARAPWLRRQTSLVQRYGVLLTAVTLFVVPFFWFRNGEGDYGGDASRLYFLDPLAYLRSMGFSSINVSGFGREYQHFFLLPFALFLQVISVVTLHRPSLPLYVFDSLLLAGAFAGVYLSIRDLVGRTRPAARAAALLGALFFVFSQVLMYNWPRYLYTFHGIALYPLLFWCGLRFLQSEPRQRKKFFLAGLLLTVVFAPSFSVLAAPALVSFFPFVAVLLGAYALLYRKFFLFCRGAFGFLVLFTLIHAFHLLPQAAAITDPKNTFHQTLFTPSGRLDRGLQYFETLRPFVRLLDNLAGFHQYDLYVQTSGSPELLVLLSRAQRFLPLFLLFPALALLGILRGHRDTDARQRALLLTVTGLFLVCTFLLTANLFGAAGPRAYAKLFSLPGFSMFRSFTGAFAVSFMFLYAVVFGLSYRSVLHALPNRSFRVVLSIGLGVLLVWQARPFLTGTLVNLPLADTRGVKLTHRFRAEFADVLAWVRTLPLDTKFLTLPLTQYDYQVIDGVSGGAYVGPSPLGLLAGRSVFAGLGAFEAPGSEILNAEFLLATARERDYRTINRIFSRLNIGLVLYDASPVIYRERFIGWPYAAGIWEAFPESEEFRRMVTRLGFREVYQRGPYTVFQYPESFLPHLYVPLKTHVTESAMETRELLVTTEQFDIRTATYRATQGNVAMLNSLPETISDPPTLEFKKILSTKYRVRVHRLRNNAPIVFSDFFHRGWRAYPVPVGTETCMSRNVDRIDARGLSHARAADIQTWCTQGLMTSVGPQYISENFNGTIQNDNLPDGPLWETWRQRPLDERTHLLANEYANSWWIDLDELQRSTPNLLKKNADGSYDLELVLEYTPQRYFYVGGAISILAVASLLVWVGFAFRVRGAVQSPGKPAHASAPRSLT